MLNSKDLTIRNIYYEVGKMKKTSYLLLCLLLLGIVSIARADGGGFSATSSIDLTFTPNAYCPVGGGPVTAVVTVSETSGRTGIVNISGPALDISDKSFTLPINGSYSKTISIQPYAVPAACTFTATIGRQNGTESTSSKVLTVYEVSVEVDKSSICTGGVNNAVHQSTITALVKPSTVTGEIGFSITNGTAGVNINPALSSSTGTAPGPVTTVLQSGDLVGSATVQVVFPSSIGSPIETIDIVFDIPDATATLYPTNINANGTDQATCSLSMIFDEEQVDGHNILWVIGIIEDVYGNIVYDSINYDDPIIDYRQGRNFGSISPSSAVTDDGTSTATLTAGTTAGFLYIFAADSHCYIYQ